MWLLWKLGDINWMKNIRFHNVFFHKSVNNANELFIRRASFLMNASADIADGWGKVRWCSFKESPNTGGWGRGPFPSLLPSMCACHSDFS